MALRQGGLLRGVVHFPYWGFFMESLSFMKQIMRMNNDLRDSERLNICTLCGNTTRGCDRKNNGVGWIQGWVHTECAEAMENGKRNL